MSPCKYCLLNVQVKGIMIRRIRICSKDKIYSFQTYIMIYLKTELTLLSTNAATIIGDKNPIEFPIALTIPATVPE